jgi:hypothetical protein
MRLYHITPPENLSSILENGIFPKLINPDFYGLTAPLSYYPKSPYVWLTDDVEYIIRTQAGSDWPHVILEIEIEIEKIIPAIYRCPKKDCCNSWHISEHEFLTSHVPADRILNQGSP